MATLKSYLQWGKDYGLEFVGFTDLTDNLFTHYTLVRTWSPVPCFRWFTRCRVRISRRFDSPGGRYSPGIDLKEGRQMCY